MSGAGVVTLGDSFVEGRGDLRGNLFHGWVPRFAGQLGVPASRVLNLGAHQATTTTVLDEQLGHAARQLATHAAVVGVVVGVNDVVSDYDPRRFEHNLQTIFTRLAATRAVVFTANYPDIPARLPVPDRFRDLLRARFAEANHLLAGVAATTGTELIDLAADSAWTRAEMWSPDGLHPSPRGHADFAKQAVAAVSARTGTIVAA
ncbi:GDSL-type esterase/lipase family protein [Gordonia sp. L191]|uniref:GDSL-type esterase/lipase family protein n=1 Tax=Gordonia sp. L191 TaxID=2982699 RepID=UPI0024C05540|nr:GDSL-type esterase/lipase family protein [Gordonia sp. L191]WHU48148.1 GDSL-type esterase/lipase family protein [Gordonia sp. L191]